MIVSKITLDSIQRINRPAHLIISNYLQKSLTMDLYRKIFATLDYSDQYLALELPTDDPYVVSSAELSILSIYLAEISRNANIRSLVISNPYKQVILQFLSKVDQKAVNIGAVNLVICENKTLYGYNIDGDAFWMGLQKTKTKIGNKVFMFGAGGVSNAVAFTLASHKAKQIGVFDPIYKKTQMLITRLKNSFPSVTVHKYQSPDKIQFTDYSVFYNGSGLGKFSNNMKDIKTSPLKPGVKLPPTAIAIDANYTPWETKFLKQCRLQKLTTTNGFSHMIAFTTLHLSNFYRNISYEFVQGLGLNLLKLDKTLISLNNEI